MPDVLTGNGMGAVDAMLFGIAADLSYTVMGATNSSPQTTELFARERSDTLWKYVRLGLLQVGVLIGIMTMRAAADGGWRRAMWPAAGGVLVGGGMFLMYNHALQSGGGDRKK